MEAERRRFLHHMRLLLCVLVVMGCRPVVVNAAPVTLLGLGASWKYLDSGPLTGVDWAQPGFDDSAWASGNAPLGYGNGDEVTVVGFGPVLTDKHVTTYFRTTFFAAGVDAVADDLQLHIRRDDGAVVHLNGVEVARTNMPGGVVDGDTTASSAIDGRNERRVHVVAMDATLLTTDGSPNVLAISVHQADPASSDIVFDAAVVVDTPVSVPSFTTDRSVVTRGPYLQLPTHNSMIVRWFTNEVVPGVAVAFGPSSTDMTAVKTVAYATSTHRHAVELTGLNPSTRYWFQVRTQGGAVVASGDGLTFRTAPVPGTNGPDGVRLLFTADFGTGDEFAIEVRNGWRNWMGSHFGGLRVPDFWCWGGDNAYNEGDEGDYDTKVFSVYEQELVSTAVVPIAGNHDVISSSMLKETGPFFSFFSVPSDGQAGGVPSGNGGYYALNYGRVHVVVLDSNEQPTEPEGEMATWLDADLAASAADPSIQWRIVMFHHPPLSKGSHDSDVRENQIAIRQDLLPILERHGVDLVLTGHSHAYERSKLLAGAYGMASEFNASTMEVDGGRGGPDAPYIKSTTPTPNDGTLYVVAGSAGKLSGGSFDHPAMLEQPQRAQEDATFPDGRNGLEERGSLIIDVNAAGNRLEGRFVNAQSEVRDVFVMEKVVPSPSTTPTATESVTATPTATTTVAESTTATPTVTTSPAAALLTSASPSTTPGPGAETASTTPVPPLFPSTPPSESPAPSEAATLASESASESPSPLPAASSDTSSSSSSSSPPSSSSSPGPSSPPVSSPSPSRSEAPAPSLTPALSGSPSRSASPSPGVVVVGGDGDDGSGSLLTGGASGSGSDDDNNDLLLIIAPVGAAVVIGLAAAGFCCWRRRRTGGSSKSQHKAGGTKDANADEEEDDDDDEEEGEETEASPGGGDKALVAAAVAAAMTATKDRSEQKDNTDDSRDQQEDRLLPRKQQQQEQLQQGYNSSRSSSNNNNNTSNNQQALAVNTGRGHVEVDVAAAETKEDRDNRVVLPSPSAPAARAAIAALTAPLPPPQRQPVGAPAPIRVPPSQPGADQGGLVIPNLEGSPVEASPAASSVVSVPDLGDASWDSNGGSPSTTDDTGSDSHSVDTSATGQDRRGRAGRVMVHTVHTLLARRKGQWVTPNTAKPADGRHGAAAATATAAAGAAATAVPVPTLTAPGASKRPQPTSVAALAARAAPRPINASTVRSSRTSAFQSLRQTLSPGIPVEATADDGPPSAPPPAFPDSDSDADSTGSHGTFTKEDMVLAIAEPPKPIKRNPPNTRAWGYAGRVRELAARFGQILPSLSSKPSASTASSVASSSAPESAPAPAPVPVPMPAGDTAPFHLPDAAPSDVVLELDVDALSAESPPDDVPFPRKPRMSTAQSQEEVVSKVLQQPTMQNMMSSMGGSSAKQVSRAMKDVLRPKKFRGVQSRLLQPTAASRARTEGMPAHRPPPKRSTKAGSSRRGATSFAGRSTSRSPTRRRKPSPTRPQRSSPVKAPVVPRCASQIPDRYKPKNGSRGKSPPARTRQQRRSPRPGTVTKSPRQSPRRQPIKPRGLASAKPPAGGGAAVAREEDAKSTPAPTSTSQEAVVEVLEEVLAAVVASAASEATQDPAPEPEPASAPEQEPVEVEEEVEEKKKDAVATEEEEEEEDEEPAVQEADSVLASDAATDAIDTTLVRVFQQIRQRRAASHVIRTLLASVVETNPSAPPKTEATALLASSDAVPPSPKVAPPSTPSPTAVPKSSPTIEVQPEPSAVAPIPGLDCRNPE